MQKKWLSNISGNFRELSWKLWRSFQLEESKELRGFCSCFLPLDGEEGSFRQSMWCFSCFSPSTRQDDPSEDHHKTANKNSRHEEEDVIVRQKREKDEQIEIDKATEESLKAFEQEEEKRRLQDSKEEGKREQVDDEQIEIDKATGESLKLFEQDEEKRRLEDSKEEGKREQVDDEQIEIERAKEISLKVFEQEEEKRRLEEPKEEGKRKQVDDEQIEIDKAKEISLKLFEQEEEKRRLEESKDEGKRKQVDDDDDQVERDKGQTKHSKDEEVKIKDGLSVNAFGKPQCVCCLHCHKPIAVDEISRKGNFHRPCFKEHRHLLLHPNCCVCQKKIPSTEAGIKYNEHPFWKEKYCPCHDDDGTAKCCSCEKLEPRGTNYVMLGDDRWLCLQCMESSVMDTYECHDLHLEIREFFEGLFLKVEKEFPLLLVEKQALNKAEEEEKIDYHHAVVTRGLCLSEEQIVTSVKERPKMGPNNTLIDMVRETQTVSGCEVTAILIIYGLPRLLTGCILAHEMMHAWLRLNGYRNLKLELEEGLCQVLGLRWLESLTFESTDVAAASSSSSRAPPATTTSKKGDDWSDFEKRLVEFCINQIKEDDSWVYGLGFKKVYDMLVSNHYNLKATLKDIVGASKSTPDSKF